MLGQLLRRGLFSVFQFIFLGSKESSRVPLQCVGTEGKGVSGSAPGVLVVPWVFFSTW